MAMRAALVALVLAACGPAHAIAPRPIDEDLGARDPAPAAAPIVPDEARVEAPPGKGLRVGAVARAHLLAVLDAGPATFLRQVEVSPRLADGRFVGWQLVQLLDHTGPLHDVDLVPGDVLLMVNGKPVSRPEQFLVVWDSLRTANELTAQLWRGNDKLELRFTIEPPLR